MTKVLLINSPIYNKKVADKEDYLPPYGLGYIATNLLNNNIETKIIDAVYNNYTIEELLEIIKKEKPDSVGINVFSVNLELVKKLIEKCNYETNFIIGGKSTNFIYPELLRIKTNNKITITIGEGDFITKDIVLNKPKEKPIIDINKRKVFIVDKNSIYFPENLDECKLDRNLFKGREILNPYGEVEEAIVTSRECYYNCAFCGGARSLNENVYPRQRSIKDIIKELKYIKENNPNTKSIRILDDLFLKNRQSIKEAIEIFKNFDFTFRAMSHVLSIKNSYDLLEALHLSGCQELEIGVESGSEEIRKRIHKAGSVKDVKDVIKHLLESGINVKAYFMYGFNNETIKDALKTYELAKYLYDYSLNTKGNFRASAFQFRPYHGTELYKEINKDLKYSHNNDLNNLEGRKQFNFTAGNFSTYDTKILNKLVIKTNQLNSEKEKIKYERNKRL